MARLKKQRRRLYAQGWTPTRTENSWRQLVCHPHAAHDRALADLEHELLARPRGLARRRWRDIYRYVYERWPGDRLPRMGMKVLVHLPWVREVDTFTASALSPLVSHVLGGHPLEPAFLQPFQFGFVGCDGSRARWARVALARTGGAGLRALKADGLLPRRFPRRRFAQLCTTTEPLTLALRRAVVESLGGSDALVRSLWRSRLRQLQVDEDRWFDVVEWLVRQRIEARDARRWVDWLTVHDAVELDELDAGKRWAEVDRWGARHMDPTRFERVTFRSSGVGRLPVELVGWSFVELRTYQALIEEGEAMRHCVATYGRRVHAGHCAIFSARLHGERALTVEVDPHRRVIRQALGLRNRRPTSVEASAVQSWAAVNGLGLR